MSNNSTSYTPPDKLDAGVKQALRNYESPFNEAHWSEMNDMLNSTAPTSYFNSKWLNPQYLFITIAAVAGGIGLYFALNSLGSSSSPKEPETHSISPDSKTTHQPSPVTSTRTQDSQDSSAQYLTRDVKVVYDGETTHVNISPQSTIAAPASGSEGTENKTITTNQPNTGPVSKKPEPAVFGDMIDPHKGAVLRTKEKEKTQRQALTKINDSVDRQKSIEAIKKEIREQSQRQSNKRSKSSNKVPHPSDETVDDVIIPDNTPVAKDSL